MNPRILFVLAAAGLLLGLFSAFVSARQPASQPPVFSPAPNPYANGIYASGIIESRQSQGANISIFPEVTGPITHVLVNEGDTVRAGASLVTIDDSVQRETTAQQQAQLAVSQAQIANAQAELRTAADTLEKQEHVFAINPGAVSRDVLDTDRNAVKVAETNVEVFRRQYRMQESAYAAAAALLHKYTLRAPHDGVVLSVEAAVGSYVSPQGAYDTYTQGYLPVVVLGSAQGDLEVRCYVDEILINRLPPPATISGRMYIQGTSIAIPLVFERVQPFVSPKIELSDQRLEQVDVPRAAGDLPVPAAGKCPPNPGQLVDVYIGSK